MRDGWVGVRGGRLSVELFHSRGEKDGVRFPGTARNRGERGRERRGRGRGGAGGGGGRVFGSDIWKMARGPGWHTAGVSLVSIVNVLCTL
ncbi:hypothetical protein V1478_009660 [Vespula squamosa]|uniref:Uncharacterized protein n=1 Tax=Vespula squamosa TaxID=30214 RepID=A0ABD2AR59_VESSQ